MRMRASLLLLLAAVAGPCALGADAARAATGAVSANWAGYAVAGAATRFRSVTATWVQPAVSCRPGHPAFSVFWVGLGGLLDSSQGLEQAGTEADCGASGRAHYDAWYELLPAAPGWLALRIAPGDSVTATVAVSGHRVRVRLADHTRRTSVTRRLRTSSPDMSSAEWIAEAPAACDASSCQPLPLANFSSVRFTHASATAGAGRARVISYPGWSLFVIRLEAAAAAAGGGAPAAVPSALASGGRSFTVSVSDVATAAVRGASKAHRYPATPR